MEHQTTETGREKASEPVASSISDHAPKKDGASSESSSDEESSSSSSGGEEGGEEEVDLSPFAKAKLRIQVLVYCPFRQRHSMVLCDTETAEEICFRA